MLESGVDVPVAILNGLLLSASKNPVGLAQSWTARAEREVNGNQETGANVGEMLADSEEELELEIGAADTSLSRDIRVVNPMSTSSGSSSVQDTL